MANNHDKDKVTNSTSQKRGPDCVRCPKVLLCDGDPIIVSCTSCGRFTHYHRDTNEGSKHCTYLLQCPDAEWFANSTSDSELDETIRALGKAGATLVGPITCDTCLELET